MLVPSNDPPKPSQYAREQTDVYLIIAAFAMALVVGIGIWTMVFRTSTTAHPPAVTATPATRAPAPAEETTGRAVPRPVPGQELDPVVPR